MPSLVKQGTSNLTEIIAPKAIIPNPLKQIISPSSGILFLRTKKSGFMQHDTHEWTKGQFHAFILVCGAFSNYRVSEAEHDYISLQLGEENFNFAMDIYRSCSDFQCIELIIEGRKKFYPSEHDKQLLESELKTMFAADHEFAILEDNFLRYLDKVL